MKADLWRSFGVICLCLAIGLLTGQVLLCLALGLLLYLYWQQQTYNQLLKWLRRRSAGELPDLAGTVEEIAHEFDFLRIRHKQRKEKLSGMLKRFQEGTAALPDAVVILGENDVIEWANKKTEKYLSIRWPQDAGQRISNLVRHPDLVAYLATTEQEHSDSRLELNLAANAGLQLEFRVTPYGDTQRLLVARDITSAARMNKMRKDFIANASHELRTPLTVIVGYLESFEDELRAGDPRKTQVKQIQVQTARMQGLIDDLLKLAALETTASDIEADDIVKVPALLASICKEAENMSGMLEHSVSIEARAGLWIKGNHNELYSAFSNLIFNAVQYSPAQGHIQIRWYEDSRGAHMEVRDAGDGIAAAHIPRLTERFYRADKGRSRAKGGTGLGLAIVKHVLSGHKARLTIDSALGKGSTFRCSFPLARVVHVADDPGPSISV